MSSLDGVIIKHVSTTSLPSINAVTAWLKEGKKEANDLTDDDTKGLSSSHTSSFCISTNAPLSIFRVADIKGSAMVSSSVLNTSSATLQQHTSHFCTSDDLLSTLRMLEGSYIIELQGAVLRLRSIIQSQVGYSSSNYGDVSGKIIMPYKCSALLWTPKKGQTEVGRVHYIGDEHMGMLVHGVFTAFLPRRNAPKMRQAHGRWWRVRSKEGEEDAEFNKIASLPYIPSDVSLASHCIEIGEECSFEVTTIHSAGGGGLFTLSVAFVDEALHGPLTDNGQLRKLQPLGKQGNSERTTPIPQGRTHAEDSASSAKRKATHTDAGSAVPPSPPTSAQRSSLLTPPTLQSRGEGDEPDLPKKEKRKKKRREEDVDESQAEPSTSPVSAPPITAEEEELVGEEVVTKRKKKKKHKSDTA